MKRMFVCARSVCISDCASSEMGAGMVVMLYSVCLFMPLIEGDCGMLELEWVMNNGVY